MNRLTEKRDGHNVIPLRQNGETKWALSSAGMGDGSTKFLYGNHADKLAEYEELGTVEECREAMEKQKIKKVIDDTAFGICPNCRNEFNGELVNEYNMKYCIYCGQAIDLRSTYKPKIIEGKISGTGWPIDGCTLILALWDWDNYGSWYLHNWKPEDDQAIMETMFIAETEVGMCLYDTLKEFADHWKEWEPEGSFCIPLKNVEVIKVLQEEQKGDQEIVFEEREDTE